MAPIDVQVGDGRIRFTGRAEGDLGPAAADAPTDLDARRRAVLDLPWAWAAQVHGAGVVIVPAPGAVRGGEADVLLTTAPRTPVAVFTADCAPIGLVGDAERGTILAAVHAGWRGLANGVVEAAVEAMRGLGAVAIRAAVGPSIHAECYAFSPGDLDGVAERLGDHVRGLTSAGAPALDVPAAVRTALDRVGASIVFESDVCTACGPQLFSYRARGDRERQAMVIWRE